MHRLPVRWKHGRMLIRLRVPRWIAQCVLLLQCARSIRRLGVERVWLARAGCGAMPWCALLLVMPITAGAATVSVRPNPDPENSGDVLVFQAQPGERNVVSARWVPNGEWEISDTGAVIDAGALCRAIDAHTVYCPERPGRYYGSFEVELGDLDDRFRSTSPTIVPPEDDVGLHGEVRADGGPGDDELVGGTWSNVFDGGDGNDVLTAAGEGSERNRLDGGPGDDRLLGGPESDDLDGGGGRDQMFGGGQDDLMSDGDSDAATGDGAPGPDLLDGGDDGCCLIVPGDRVSYSGRSAAVSVDLADTQSDGEAGEGDVLVGVESIEGGSGDDRLAGDAATNSLLGGPGADQITGKAGHDTLLGGAGADHITGSAGDDTLDPGGGADTVRCDSGDDSVSDPHRAILVPRGCESVTFGMMDSYRPYPKPIASGSLQYTAACPYVETDGEPVPPCRGRVRLVQASGRHRTLAGTAMPLRRRTRERVAIPLTALGRRVAASGRKVRAIVHFHYHAPSFRDFAPSSRDFAWTVELELPR